MKRLSLTLILSIYSLNAFTQQKSFSGDLRSKKEVFSLHEKKTKSPRVYKLEKSAVGEFNLSFIRGNQLVRTWKMTRNEAKSLDDTFFDQFLSLKYDMKAYKKDCISLYSLVMHSSDTLNVCKTDHIRIKAVKKLLTKIQKEFKI